MTSLNQEIFFSIAETRVVVEDYRRLYNGERPHSEKIPPKNKSRLERRQTLTALNFGRIGESFAGNWQAYNVRGERGTID